MKVIVLTPFRIGLSAVFITMIAVTAGTIIGSRMRILAQNEGKIDATVLGTDQDSMHAQFPMAARHEKPGTLT